MLRNFKVVLIALAILFIAGSVYAFAAQNTITESAAGYAASSVPSYDVTSVVYDLNDTNPASLDAITFNISPLSGSAKALVVQIQTQTGGTWTECSLADDVLPARVATCTVGPLDVEDVTALNILASSRIDLAP